MSETAAKPRVRWSRIGLFYGIALGWAILVAAVLFALGQRDLSGSAPAQWITIALAIGYMPVPLVAALIMEKLDGRGFAVARLFAKGWPKRILSVFVVTVVMLLVLLIGMLVASWLAGNVLGISGAGKLLFTHEDLLANVIANTNGSLDTQQVASMSAQLPSLLGLLAMAAGGALVVGFTINGLFAFGEEYGWRGWLADELAPLGAVRANLITGVLWGLWHAPLILLGYNYGASYGVPGVGFMVLWCTAASFLLMRAREVTGTVLAAATVHGTINGFAGVFLIVLVDAHPLIAAPMGLIGIAVVAMAAVLLWVFARPQESALPMDDELAQSMSERPVG